MSFEVTFEDRHDYLYVRVTGPNSPETVVGYMKRVRKECDERNCRRILIDENLDGPRLDLMEIFALVAGGSQEALGFFDAIAYVDEKQDMESVRFAETVAVNRGIPAAVFASVEDAEDWLINGRGNDSGADNCSPATQE